MVDREQIRRDAELTVKTYPAPLTAYTPRYPTAVDLARQCLALLAELEQAEKERGEASWGLVEAVRYIAKEWDGQLGTGQMLTDFCNEALAAFEADQ